MRRVDLIVHGAGQLITVPGLGAGPQRGAAFGALGVIEDGAVAAADGTIVAVGRSAEIRAAYTAETLIDADGAAVMPGFVDCHTHTVFGGDRVGEFEQRVQGATYMEIMAAGGGIVSTMRQTRAAPVEELVVAGRRWLDKMLALGTTTVEIKTGYGLSLSAEQKMLDAIEQLDAEHVVDIVPTYLAAHTVPPEYAARTEAYVDLVVTEMLPAAAAWYARSRFSGRVPFFVDVFCEDHAFDVAQTRRILQAARALGLPLKAHVDQFNALGGLEVAVSLDATSVDHLDVTAAQGIGTLASAATIAVLLPAVNFNLGHTQFAPARDLADAGAAVALATDFNPGSAPIVSLPLVMAIATRYLRLTPAEALVAITRNAAHAVGLAHRLGTLAPGYQADLVILDSPDYRHLTYLPGTNLVRHVIKAGRLVVSPST